MLDADEPCLVRWKSLLMRWPHVPLKSATVGVLELLPVGESSEQDATRMAVQRASNEKKRAMDY